jgi:2-hydroxychromene-2-carboxylate isomerase
MTMTERAGVLDYYLTPLSPYVYLAGSRPAEIAARHGLTIRYRPLDTTALFGRTGGMPLAQRHENRRAYRLQELRRRAIRAGKPITIQPRHFPTNPAPACYAIIAAQQAGGGDVGALVADLAAACWAREQDIAEDATIRAALSAAGFDPDLADKGLFAGAEEYGRNLEQAVIAGVFGVPFLICGEERFWGEDRLDDLDLWLSGKL